MIVVRILTPDEQKQNVCSFDGCRGHALYLSNDYGFMCIEHYKLARKYEELKAQKEAEKDGKVDKESSL